MGRPSRETVMNALLNTLVASVQQNFTADLTIGDPTVYNPSSTVGLFIGLPIIGAGIPQLTTITSLAPLTMSQPASANGSNVPCTTGFLTFGRRLIPWAKVAEQPALFLREPDEELQYVNIILQAQTIKAEVWIYSKSGNDTGIAPITGLNNLLDAVQAALAPDDPSTGRFTLGGLVHWCRMEGKVEKEPGDLDGQAIAVAEVLITVP